LSNTKKYISFKHWKTGDEKVIEYEDWNWPVNPNSDRIVVWNVTENKLEDILKSTIIKRFEK